MYEVI